MRMVTVSTAAVGVLLMVAGSKTGPLAARRADPGAQQVASAPDASTAPGGYLVAAGLAPEAIDPADLTAVMQRTCVICHNDQALTGGVSLQTFDVARATEN